TCRLAGANDISGDAFIVRRGPAPSGSAVVAVMMMPKRYARTFTDFAMGTARPLVAGNSSSGSFAAPYTAARGLGCKVWTTAVNDKIQTSLMYADAPWRSIHETVCAGRGRSSPLDAQCCYSRST